VRKHRAAQPLDPGFELPYVRNYTAKLLGFIGNRNATDYDIASTFSAFRAAHSGSKLAGEIGLHELLWRGRDIHSATVTRWTRLADLFDEITENVRWPIKITVKEPRSHHKQESRGNRKISVDLRRLWLAIDTIGIEKLTQIKGKEVGKRIKKAVATLMFEEALYSNGPLRAVFVQELLASIGERKAGAYKRPSHEGRNNRHELVRLLNEIIDDPKRDIGGKRGALAKALKKNEAAWAALKR
jgi:hypothetical protein